MCTTIEINYGKNLVLGRNMDYDVPIDYNILFLPKDYIFGKDLEGRDLISKHPALGVCFNNYNPLKDGVNEYGLSGVSNLFIGNGRHSKKIVESKINLSSLDYLNYALTNYKDIDELLKDLPNIVISERDNTGKKVICPDFHYYFIDRGGKSIVLEPHGGIFKVFQPKDKVMTNSPDLDRHMERFMKFKKEKKIYAKDLPGGYDPTSRYIKVAIFVENSPELTTNEEAVGYAYSVLEAVKMPEGFTKTVRDHTFTRYVCVYDSKDSILTVKSHRNPQVLVYKIKDFLHIKERQSIDIQKTFKL